MLSKLTGSSVIHVSTSHLHQVTICENVHVEEQNLPPQNTSLECVLYWAEKKIKAQKTQEETLTFPLTALKIYIKALFPE